MFGEGKSFICVIVQLNPEQNVSLGEKNLLKIANDQLKEFLAYMKLRKTIATTMSGA